jgi:excisionase family DNA binding protein
MDTDTDYLTAIDVARMLGVREQTLALWRSTGRHSLPFVRVGGRVRYRRSDVDAWLTSRSGTSTSAITASLAAV